MRFISAAKRFVDADGRRQGPSPAAFELRPDDEGGLSVTQVEHFGSFSRAARSMAAAAHRETLESKRLGPEAIFAWSQVGAMIAAGDEYDKQLRVVHDPVKGNPAHAEVRRFSDEDLDLLAFFASDVFREYETVAQMGVPPRITAV